MSAFERVGAVIERVVTGGRPLAVCLACGTRYVLDQSSPVDPDNGYRCGAAVGRSGLLCRGPLVKVRGNGGE